jgi:hypothetical protein
MDMCTYKKWKFNEAACLGACFAVETMAAAEDKHWKGSQQGCQMAYFLTKNPDLGKFYEGLAMEGAGIFYVHFVHFMAIWSIVWPIGLFKVNWYIFSPFWYVAPRKIWQPWFAGSRNDC